MAIPDYQTIMLPLIRMAGTVNPLNLGQLSKNWRNISLLRNESVSELLPSGKQQTLTIAVT